jgi:hypothetical protein
VDLAVIAIIWRASQTYMPLSLIWRASQTYMPLWTWPRFSKNNENMGQWPVSKIKVINLQEGNSRFRISKFRRMLEIEMLQHAPNASKLHQNASTCFKVA